MTLNCARNLFNMDVFSGRFSVTDNARSYVGISRLMDCTEKLSPLFPENEMVYISIGLRTKFFKYKSLLTEREESFIKIVFSKLTLTKYYQIYITKYIALTLDSYRSGLILDGVMKFCPESLKDNLNKCY